MFIISPGALQVLPFIPTLQVTLPPHSPLPLILIPQHIRLHSSCFHTLFTAGSVIANPHTTLAKGKQDRKAFSISVPEGSPQTLRGRQKVAERCQNCHNKSRAQVKSHEKAVVWSLWRIFSVKSRQNCVIMLVLCCGNSLMSTHY